MASLLCFMSIGKLTQLNENLIRIQDTRSLWKKVMDLGQSLFKECSSRYNRSSNPLNKESFPYLRLNGTYTEQRWSSKSKRLVVLIHGLNSSPLSFSSYLSHDSETSLFAPRVYKKGYCKVEEAAAPILQVVQDYVQKHPENPVYLVGHSFGAKIAQDVEMRLVAKTIHLISIAGPHCGAKLLGGDLQFNSPQVLKQLDAWQRVSLGKSNVKRTFYATADDWRVFPIETSFPRLPHSSYHLLSGESHVTIIDAVAEKVLKEIGIYSSLK